MLSTSSKWLILAVVTGAGVLVYLLAPVIMPFLMGALLAYLGDPLVDRLEAKKLSRTLSVVIVFTVIFLVVLLVPVVLLPLIEHQVSALATNFPKYIDWVQQNIVPWISQTFNVDPAILNTSTLKQSIVGSWREVGGVAGNIVSGISKSGMVLLAWIANLVLVPVVTFYLLRDWDVLMEKIHQLLPRKSEPTIVKLAKESDDVLGQFLRGQVTVMIALGTIYTVGLWIVGLDLALLVGMVAGLVSFVPYLGFIVGIVFAGIAAIMQFGDITYLFYILIVFGVGQAFEGMLLTPLLVGDKIGLHPVAVIFAVMAGGQLFGFVGVLLALPIAAIVVVLLRHVHELYKTSEIYGEAKSKAQVTDNEKGSS